MEEVDFTGHNEKARKQIQTILYIQTSRQMHNNAPFPKQDEGQISVFKL